MPTKADIPIPEGWMRISKAAEQAGISRQSLEYYIMIGLVRPLRLASKRSRFFDKESIKRIKLVKQLNQTGYTLRDIREIYLEHPAKS